jgi:hypothetical protein
MTEFLVVIHLLKFLHKLKFLHEQKFDICHEVTLGLALLEKMVIFTLMAL